MSMKRYSPSTPTSGMREDDQGPFVLHSDCAPPWKKERPSVRGAYWLRNHRGFVMLVSVGALYAKGHAQSGTYFEQPLSEIPGDWEWCGPLYKPEK